MQLYKNVFNISNNDLIVFLLSRFSTMEEVIKRANDTQYGLAAGWTVLIINTENINLSFYTIYSYLFGSVEVNQSCKNSHYYTVQEEQF